MKKDNAMNFLGRFTDVENVEFLDVLEALPDLSKDGPWLAGGALRRTLIGMELDSDFDFFFKSADQLQDFRKQLEKLEANKINESEGAETYILRINGKDRYIQLVKIGYYETPEQVIDSFDFTITQIAYDGTDLYFGDYTLWDLPRKRLALHKLTYGVATMRRLIKYTSQGFTACAGVMKSILEAVVENPSVVQSEVQYVD